jgi:hypothetical protein
LLHENLFFSDYARKKLQHDVYFHFINEVDQMIGLWKTDNLIREKERERAEGNERRKI